MVWTRFCYQWLDRCDIMTDVRGEKVLTEENKQGRNKYMRLEEDVNITIVLHQ